MAKKSIHPTTTGQPVQTRPDPAKYLAITLGFGCALVSVALAQTPAGQPKTAPTPSPTSLPSYATPLPPTEARQLGVGALIPDASATDLQGKQTSWRCLRGQKATVLVMTSASCPLCQKFTPALAALEAQYTPKGVTFVFVNVSGTDTPEQMQAHRAALGGQSSYLNDPQLAIAAAVRARTTTEAFLLDTANTLIYRGAVSDQFALGSALDVPRQSFLESALDDLLTGKPPATSATTAPGCLIEPSRTSSNQTAADAAPAASSTVTYTKDIARIVQNNCLQCHRVGGVAPFALDSYQAVAQRAAMIQSVTQAGIMPPWFAAPPADPKSQTGPWANDRSLTSQEKDTIASWIKAGKPRGDDIDAPAPRSFATGQWSIGKPDAVFQLPNPIAVKADGVMPYQMVRIPTNLAEDKWVRAVQILPSDKSVVHHVLVFAIPTLDARGGRLAAARDAIDETRGFFAAYVPGNDSVIYPAGLAKPLPKGATLLFQIHYTPNGKATTDQMQIGFIFGDTAPEHTVRTAGIVNRRLNIPPNTAGHIETASVIMPADAKLLDFMPHMHVRGQAFRYELQTPGGEPRTLLDIPRYDFNWQLRYVLQTPLDIAKGSTLLATAWYDNSAANPANPDPNKRVRWGPQTYDEMMLGYVEYYLVTEDPSHPDELPPGSTPERQPSLGGARTGAFDRLLKLYDTNKDGKLQRSEVPEKLLAQFDRLDTNKDGIVTREEFER